MTGLKFKLLRKRCGISRRQIADILEVSERTVHYWEAGRYMPSKKACEMLLHIHKLITKAVEACLNDALYLYRQGSHDVVSVPIFSSHEKIEEKGYIFASVDKSLHMAMNQMIAQRSMDALELGAFDYSIEYT